MMFQYPYLSAIGINFVTSVTLYAVTKKPVMLVFALAFFGYMLVEYVGQWYSYWVINNVSWYNYVYPIIFASITVLFIPLFEKGSWQRKLMLFSIPLYTAISYLILNTLIPSGHRNMACFQASYVIWLAWALLWFAKKFNAMETTPILRDPGFWISSGILLSSGMILFMFLMDFLQSKGMIDWMNLFNLLLQVFLFVSQWKFPLHTFSLKPR
jgi:hypothetical protein